MTGLPMLAIPSGVKKADKSKIDALKKKATEAPPPAPIIPEQMELPFVSTPQQMAEMQARSGAQPDLFAPANQSLEAKLPPVSSDAARAPIPDEAQGHLPFDTSLDEVARTQRAADPQLDLFSNERPSDVPYNALEAQQRAQSVDQLQRLNRDGTQQHIVEDFGNNDPMERMPNMRVDENGMCLIETFSIPLHS